MQNFNLYTTLQPVQIKFGNSLAKYRLFGGAKGGGKSYGIRAEAVKQAMSAEGVRGLVLRRTTKEIEENMIVPLQRELPPETTGFYKFNKTNGIFTFHNKSTIRFSYCQNLKDVLNYQGIEYDFIAIEELTHWDELERQLLIGSLRSTREGITPNFFASTNPGSRGHARVKRLWVDRDFRENENPNDFEFIPARVWDNPILLKYDPKYITNLEMLPDKERRAFLEGDRDVFDGQFFGEFRKDIHVVQPFIPREGIKKRIIAFDYGYTKPSAVYRMAQDNQGKVTIYREMYVTQKTYRQLALMIMAMTPASEHIDQVFGDPAIMRKPSETTGTNGEDEMKAVGLKVKGADNARISGWQVFRQYLQPYEDQNTGQITSNLQITSNCVNLIRTLPTLVHDKVNVEDIDTTLEDHAADAVRYGLKELGAIRTTLTDIKAVNAALNKRVTNAVKEVTSSFKKKPDQDKKKTTLLTTNF